MKKSLIVLAFILSALIFPLNAIAQEESQDATDYYNQAIDLYKAEKIDESIEMFQKAIKLNPKFYEAHYNLAQILMSLNKDKDAYEAFAQVVKLKPDDWESVYNVGIIQYKRGYLANSYSYLKTIEEKTPQYDSARLYMAKIEKRQKELNLESTLKEHKKVVDSSGKVKGVEIAEYEAPSGVATDSRGNIYLASYSENAIYKISTQGQKSTFTKSTLLKGPIGIAADKENNIYVANYDANNIVKITSEGSASIFANIQKPYCITYDVINNRLYATEQNTNTILKFDL